MTTKTERMKERIAQHGRHLLAIFPRATEKDPDALCRKLRRLETKAAAIGLQLCNGPQMAEGEQERRIADVLGKVNALLGNVHEYQPKTGAKCGCKRGVQRDNCPNCEGTGHVVDFKAIRNRTPLVPIFINLDPRGYALKIDDSWMRAEFERLRASSKTVSDALALQRLHRDMGGYGILAPDLRDE